MEFSNSPATAVSTGRLRLAQGLVLLFHLTGFVGLAFSQNKAFYLNYTPLTLLLTAGLLAAFQPMRGLVFWLFVAQTFLLGMVAEVVGTNTGLLFGHYIYGATLGPQYMSAPWLIGLNWVLVTYLAGTLAAYLPASGVVRVLVGAVLMVGFDLCMEPVAGRYDFWHWTGDLVPLRNFRDWFLLALVLQVLFVRTPFPKRNPLAPLVYLVQLLFFFGLGLLVP
ncbi:carotenoid biosynthesis protein [Hymenobacter baengnokdamensis]|uniref:carotenoid biosynthesis protein n=1 Tax=Hymenobacter baengnokdamensis TaxID=2615203 RepID=UPI001246C068|nr:carotenoid biosynthesis protein [Hymenobacter baengnokdamensis]